MNYTTKSGTNQFHGNAGWFYNDAAFNANDWFNNSSGTPRPHAVANQYFVGAINRPGFEDPWRIGEFYGQSYFCTPRGQMLAVGKRDDDDVVVADLDLDMIREVRNTWQFFRDRRPETYGQITQL